MRKPKSNSNKIKTVQINVMDSHNNLDDLKANAGITGNNDVVDNSDIDNMKSILENLKNTKHKVKCIHNAFISHLRNDTFILKISLDWIL